MALDYGALAAVLIVVGSLLSRLDGVWRVVGLFCLAYGIGMAIAAAFAARGYNPLQKRRRR
jgi:hypothetical protein